MLMLTACSNPDDLFSERAVNKYNAYIDILNTSNAWLSRIEKSYFGQFGYEEEMEIKPRLTEHGWFFFDSDNLYDDRSKNTTQQARGHLSSKPDYEEADTKMLQLCDVLDAVIKLCYDDINNYYRNKEFAQDDFAKGRAYHSQMLARFTELSTATVEFMIAFQPIISKYDEAELARLEKEGLEIRAYRLKLIQTATKIGDLFRMLEFEGVDFLKADLAQYEPLCTAFAEDLETLILIVTENPDKYAKEGFGDASSFARGRFMSIASDIKAVTTDILTMIKAGTTEIEPEFTGSLSSGQPKMTSDWKYDPVGTFEGQLDGLIRFYNQSVH